MVYLTHPNHGTHIAYTQQEVESCLKAGWTIRQDKPESKPAEKPKGKK